MPESKNNDRQNPKKKNKDPVRAGSIARRIQMSVWLNKLLSYLMIDLAAVVMVAALFVAAAFGWPEERGTTDHAGFEGNSYDTLIFRVERNDGAVEEYPVKPWGDRIIFVGRALLALELVDLIIFATGTGKFRTFLRPLEELAEKAEAISAISLDTTTKFNNLEEAIRHVSAENDTIQELGYEDLMISTGDHELSSIESALNHLLTRMQEGYRQQVRFVSDASHELRTPIAVIQGYADLLARWGKDDPEILQEGITSIRVESEHMKELVEQLLFLARGDSGRNVLEMRAIDLNTLMREVWDESVMIDPDHEYILDLPGLLLDSKDPDAPENSAGAAEAAWISGDTAMIKQSVRIFLQNAMKYSEKGDTIRLGVRVNGGTVSYIVEDEGIGMASSDIAHIFERFYRSDEARDSKTGGTGLGLSIVKWIVDAHDGTIDVVSRKGIGTRFTVNFKRLETQETIEE